MTTSDLPRPVVIQYARPMDGVNPLCASAARWMITLAVLSAACVGSCFLTLMSGGNAGFVQVLVFAATLAVAFKAGRYMGRAGELSSAQLALDCIAGAGLLIVGLAPIAIMLDLENDLWVYVLALAYALMALTTWRHVLLYRRLAVWALRLNRPALRLGLLQLAYVKFVYEALWLGCCAIALAVAPSNRIDDLFVFFALAALFGCGGYGLIWIWMVIAHGRLATALGAAARRL
jgi:hypothetical protein